MEYVQMTINDWLEVKHKLKMELQGVKQSFVRIGYVLRKIDDQKLYENDGYKSIAEFAKEEYGLEASTVSRFMSINREYSIDGYSEHLREEYLEMGRSQLEEMLKLPDKDREMIHPETSREQIRELKRFNKQEPVAGVADDVLKLIEKFYEDNPDILNAVFTEEADFQDVLERKIEIVNPSGNRSYKKGLFFLMMYEDSIKIKKFGSDPQTMSWKEFFDITMMIFGESAAGKDTYDNYFGVKDDGKNDGRTAENLGNTECGEFSGTGGRIDKNTSEKPENTADEVQKTDDLSEKNTVNEQKSTDLSPAEQRQEAPVEEKELERVKNEGEKACKPAEIQNKECFQTEKTGKKAGNPKKTPEKGIAPAQKSAETQNREPILESENKSKKEPLKEVMNVPENKRIRKDYMETLTIYGMADYLGKTAREINDLDYLKTNIWWEDWLNQMVDEKGRVIEDE